MLSMKSYMRGKVLIQIIRILHQKFQIKYKYTKSGKYLIKQKDAAAKYLRTAHISTFRPKLLFSMKRISLY